MQNCFHQPIFVVYRHEEMNDNKTTIEFVNHASALISFGKIGILSDPWYSKSVFHHGWRLLYENENQYINEVLATTKCWINYEVLVAYDYEYMQLYCLAFVLSLL